MIKTHTKLMLVAGLGALLSACQPVFILSQPVKQDQELTFESAQDDPIETSVTLGSFDVYSVDQELAVTWAPYDFDAAGITTPNRSYRLSLLQFPVDPAAPNQDGTEIKVAHHWVDAAAQDTRFSFGSFGFGEEVCLGCPTLVLIVAETYAVVPNPVTGGQTYAYTPLADPNSLFSDDLFATAEGISEEDLLACIPPALAEAEGIPLPDVTSPPAGCELEPLYLSEPFIFE